MRKLIFLLLLSGVTARAGTLSVRVIDTGRISSACASAVNQIALDNNFYEQEKIDLGTAYDICLDGDSSEACDFILSESRKPGDSGCEVTK